MGKKNKKSRRYDDGDLLLGDEIATNDNILEAAKEDTIDGEDSSAMPIDETQDADETPNDTASFLQAKEQLNNNAKPKQSSTSIINIDLIKLEATMTEVLKSYENNYQSEDWLHRTIEKNMHLPKHSLKSNLESHILDDMLSRVENEVQTKLDIRYDEDMKNKSKFDVLLAEISAKKSELSSVDEVTLREQAILARLDPDEVIDTVREAISSASNDTGEVDEQQQQLDNYSMSVSILLALQPYIQQQCSTHQSLIYFIMRHICLVLYKVLSLILGEQASARADQLWEKIHLPKLKAEQLAQEQENDNKMLQNNMHLWSTEQQTWIEKDKVYHPAAHTSTIPPTIRYNTTRKAWERWQKNLTTRTKAMKQAAAIGKVAPPFTRGTFVPVRAGEGWASAPDQAEVDNEQIVSGSMRFFVCLPTKQQQQQQQSTVSEKQQLFEVVDVTTWVSKTLLSKEVAREVGAVDSGKELFSLDVSSLLIGKKGGKKGNKNSNNNRGPKKNQSKDGNNKDDDDEISVRKGVGYTALVNDKYMDRMNNK